MAVNANTLTKLRGHTFDHKMLHKEIKETKVDGVTKVQEKVVMMVIKLGQQQEQGHCAHISKDELSSMPGSGVMKD